MGHHWGIMHQPEGCSFSIFFCGCKQPKSIHIGFSGAKVAIFPHPTKRKGIFQLAKGTYWLAS